MSNTLEERVAALEWCIHDKFPEYDLVTMVGQFAATSDPQEPYTHGGSVFLGVRFHDPGGGHSDALTEEPYRLDTKPNQTS